MGQGNRIEWLDIAKGIVIILMIVGHSGFVGPNGIQYVVGNFIFAFHMPFFFLASGLTTSWSSWNDFLTKKVRGLLFPFFYYSVIILLLNCCFLQDEPKTYLFSWLQYGWLGYALWFVPVLFISLITCRILKGINKKFWRIVAMIILLFTGYTLRHYHVFFPWNMSTVPYATCLIYIGSIMPMYIKQVDIMYRKWYLYPMLFILTLIICYFFRMDMAWNKCYPVVILTIGALSGSALICMISKSIETRFITIRKIMIRIGQETFFIMAFSQVIMCIFNQYFELHFVLRYLLLVVLLIVGIYLKNRIIHISFIH